jgi:hypothetical protein
LKLVWPVPFRCAYLSLSLSHATFRQLVSLKTHVFEVTPLFPFFTHFHHVGAERTSL